MNENIEEKNNEVNNPKATSDEFLTANDFLKFIVEHKSLFKTILSGYIVAYNISLLLYIAIRLAFGGEIMSTDLFSLFYLTIIPGILIGFVFDFMKTRDFGNAIKQENGNSDRLLELKDLLDKGILTQDEFDEQKKKILNK